MSMKGTGSDEITYTGSTRFQSAQIGIGVPLFFSGQKAKINSAKTNQLVQENNLQLATKQFENDYLLALKQFEISKSSLEYFENTGLKNSQLIIKTANQQLSNGDISYLEWVLVMNQAVSLQNDYANTLFQYNQSIIHLNYLSSK